MNQHTMSVYEVVQTMITLLGWGVFIGIVWQKLNTICRAVDKLEGLNPRVEAVETAIQVQRQLCDDRGSRFNKVEQIVYKNALKMIIIVLLGTSLLSCANIGSRTVSTNYHDCLTSSSASVTTKGIPAIFGEPHEHLVATADGAESTSGVSKKTLGIVVGGLGGALIGACAGNPAVGALVGTIAASIGQVIYGQPDVQPMILNTMHMEVKDHS